MGGTTALDSVLRQASAVRVGPVSGDAELRVELADSAEAARLRAAMAVDSIPDSYCMCLGDVRFELLDRDGGQLDSVVLHHGSALRWSGWEGDAVLADGRLLLGWLAGHGMPGPLEQFEAERRAGEKRRAQRREWLAAMPAGLDGFADRILGASPFDLAGEAELCDELVARLREELPDPVERALALLAWFGAGSGRCSGHPSYEGMPGKVLAAMPITDLLSALADPRADERHVAGAVRHLVGWKSRPDQERDVAALPDGLRARLLAHARRSGDTDKQSRAEGWLAPGRS
ncbi:hypothetical protein [Kitasatospora terrestris]|uniref:PE-PGRS family protein n=1 Tax=Kitasatospora terrestris TaxID=258051 RepID=A0ABP9DD68_9ACTN